MAIDVGTTLYAGSLSEAVIYMITQGTGLDWAPHVATETAVGGKPRALKRAAHSGSGLQANIKNPVQANFNDSTGDVVFSERQLTTLSLIYLDEIDVKDFENDFVKFQPSGTSLDLKGSPAIERAVRDMVFDYIQNAITLMHSSGVAGGDSYNGFETLIEADGNTNKVGAGAAIIDTNVVERVNAVIDAVPRRLHKRQNLVFHVSQHIADLYAREIVKTQNYKMTNNGDEKLYAHTSSGKKIELSVKDGLSDDFGFIAESSTNSSQSNLVQGVWADADTGGLIVSKDQPYHQTYKIVWRADFGVQYKASEDIYYMTATA